MALKAKEAVEYTRKEVWVTFKFVYRSGRDHPFVWGMMVFLLVLYRYVPSLFHLAISSSPVIFCTAILLGFLIIYGEPNILEREEDKGVSSRKDRSSANNVIVKKGENFSCNEGVHRAVGDRGHKKGFSVQNRADGEEEVSKGEGSGKRQNDKQPYISDSVCSSPWQSVDGHEDSSRSGSEQAEGSSPDAFVTDIIPMLDELHPLLDPDAPQPVHRSLDDSDVASSGETSQNQESEDGSIEEEEEEEEEEEVEIPEDEEEEANEGKDDAHEAVVKWTADDQKNVMDLGTSELERNQRLENLLAKRRARKFLSFHADKNLIDFESNDPVPHTEERPRVVTFQIPSICAPKRNPFDLPYEEEQSMGLPPIPGSAPSVLQPRRNPFDHPYDQDFENCSRSSGNQQEYSVFKPYFIPDRGSSFLSVQRESSEMGDSKANSSDESDTSSSDMGREDHKELMEQELHQESRLLSPPNQYAESLEQNSQSSEEEDIIDVSHEQIAVDRVDKGIKHEEYSFPDSDAGKIEVIEERYDDSSSSSSTAYEKSSKMGSNELPNNLELSKDSSYPNDSIQPAAERSDDNQVAEPVYDSSPSATEKSSALFADTAKLVNSEERVHESNGKDKERPETGEIWVAPPSLSLVDEYESRSREITEIKERDVIQVELSATREEFSHPVSPVLSKLVFPPRLSLSGNLSDNPLMVEAVTSFNTSYAVKPLTPREVPTLLQSQRASLDRLQLGMADLPSIPEEHPESLQVEDILHESVMDPTTVLVENPTEGFAEEGELIVENDVVESSPILEGSNTAAAPTTKTSNGRSSGGVKTLGKIRNMAKLKFKY